MMAKIRKKVVEISALFLIVFFGSFIHTLPQQTPFTAPPLTDIAQAAPVLFNNKSEVIPLKDLANRKIASISFGTTYSVQFDNMLRNYAAVKAMAWGLFKKEEVAPFNTLILQVNASSLANPAVLSFIQEQTRSGKDVILAGFGNVTALQTLGAFANPIFWNPQETAGSAEHAAQVILGGEGSLGRLTQHVSPAFPAGAGYSTWQTRLRYHVDPAHVGVDSSKLSQIDDIVNEALREHATPGAVVMVVKQGTVIFNKAYGYHTYDADKPTNSTDIFDLASVTKTAATTMAAMRLYEQQKLNLSSSIGTYLPDVQNSNKSNIPVREVMLHEAGFVNLDFTSGVKALDHSPDSSFFYPIKVADNYFMRRDFYRDKMWPKMLKSPLPTRGQYVYSDISMYMMKEIIERQAQRPLDKFVLDEFYTPLGMRTAGFNPRRRFDRDIIVPTENDTYFRKTLLQGYVHDQGAALVDGVSGHAGLFASANDLAILNQMLLNGGTYGGVEYFKPETVDLFTKRQSNVSYRGYGFDRASGHGYPSKLASTETFGHTGYTGTCVWVDPKYKLVYIFLSNRVHPSVSGKLNSLRIRPRIQDVVYSAIIEGEKNLSNLGE